MNNIPEGVSVNLSGAASELERTWIAMKNNVMIALFVIFLLLTVLMKSFVLPLVIMITPFIRLAVLIAVMLVFIRPMSSDIEFQYGVTELFVLSALYFPAVIPHLLVSKLPFWKDTNFIVHLLVGVICLFVAPYPVFVYFTCTAIFHAGKVVALHLMEFTHEEKSNFTR